LDALVELKMDPERLARRRTFALLAAVALISALTGVLFVMIWKSYVESLEPEYFREQGIRWGSDFQRRIEKQTNRFIVGASPYELGAWRENIQEPFVEHFSSEFRQNPSITPRQLALLVQGEKGGAFRTALPIGKGLENPPPNKSFRHDLKSGLDVAVVTDQQLVLVVVEGPVNLLRGTGDSKVEPIIGESLRFRLIVEFRPFDLMTDRGTTYAVVLVIVYLAVIYVLFIQVFRLGRRQMKLALSAKEKSIRLKAISSVAEGIAHEVRNPLNAISLNVQYVEKLLNKPGHSPEPGDFQRVYRELGKIRKVIDNFVNFAKTRDMEISDWSMATALDDCLRDVGARIKEEKIVVFREDSGDLTLSGDRAKITQVLANLIENAIEAMAHSEDKTIDVELSGTPGTVHAAIRNHGETPDEDVVRNLFDPYFTTRRGSLGLGLTLAKTVVDSHGGRITATAPPGGGLLVTVTLPREF
jgi:signal transduction histidine kinase